MAVLCTACNQEKPPVEFYGRPSRRGTCKDCYKARVRKYRAENLEQVQAYDRERGQLAHRKEAVRLRAPTRSREPQKAWIERNRDKRRAHSPVSNGLRDGKLTKPPACACGRSPVTAHHDDYSRPLEVRWLCTACHGAHHRELNEQRRSDPEMRDTNASPDVPPARSYDGNQR